MSFDAITNITRAEADAQTSVAAAEAKAKQMLADAENAGKGLVESACAKADSELAELRRQVDEKAVTEAGGLSSTLENRKAALRAKAEGKLAIAAELVVERIVKS